MWVENPQKWDFKVVPAESSAGGLKNGRFLVTASVLFAIVRPLKIRDPLDGAL